MGSKKGEPEVCKGLGPIRDLLIPDRQAFDSRAVREGHTRSHTLLQFKTAILLFTIITCMMTVIKETNYVN